MTNTAREAFRSMIRYRTPWRQDRTSPEWQWRTRAARKLFWLATGRPTTEWTEQ